MTYGTGILKKHIAGSNSHHLVSVKNQFCSQDRPHSRTQNRKSKSDNLTNQILRTSVGHTGGMHPRTFCRRWYGLSAINKNGKPRFTEDQILAMESEHGYREQCINLIAKLLKVKPNTVQRWGKGVAFDKIPTDKREKYEVYLGYVDAIRVITMSLKELDETSLLKLLQDLETRQIDKS